MTLASGFAGDNDALPIRADARVLATTLKAGETAEYALGKTRNGYLVPAAGASRSTACASTPATARRSATRRS